MRRQILFIFCVLLLVSSNAHAKTTYFFKGNLDLTTNELNVDVKWDEDSNLTAKIRKVSDKDYHLAFKFDHLKALSFDFSSEIESSLEIDNSREDLYVSGKISSQYSLVDFKPINELNSHFEIKDQKLILHSMSFGDITAKGEANLDDSKKLDFTINIASMNVDDFIDIWVQNKTFESDGEVSGKIEVSGSVDNPYLRGNLHGTNGYIKDLDFADLKLSIEGNYPRMEIAHSTLSDQDGLIYTLGGHIDLSDQKNFKRQIKSLDIAPLVSDNTTGSEWTIKRYNQDDNGQTEFKYLLKESETSSGAEESAGVFQIERSMKF